MNPLSIAYLCADRGVPIGGTKGASAHVRGVSEALCRRGHHVRLVATRVLPESSTLSSEVHPVSFDRTLKDLRDAIAGDGAHDPLAREVYGLMLNESVTRTLEQLHAEAPIEAVYERYSLWSWAGQRFTRSVGVPWILEVNAPLAEEQRKYRGLQLEPVATGIEAHLWRQADTIVVPSAELRDVILARVGDRPRVAVMPNGVDVELFDPADRTDDPGPGEDRFVIAFSGSLKPWHGVDRLLKAFAQVRQRVPNAELLVIGDGPMADAVRGAMSEWGDAVTWTGGVAHEEVPRWLARAHVGVAPYPQLDTFYFSPMKIVEYLASGLPVVASRIGQIPELVEEGETGRLVPPGDTRALADALVELARDRRTRRRMGRRARERALRRHDWQGIAAEVEAIFEKRRDAACARSAAEESAA